jgi:hypothetical protein
MITSSHQYIVVGNWFPAWYAYVYEYISTVLVIDLTKSCAAVADTSIGRPAFWQTRNHFRLPIFFSTMDYYYMTLKQPQYFSTTVDLWSLTAIMSPITNEWMNEHTWSNENNHPFVIFGIIQKDPVAGIIWPTVIVYRGLKSSLYSYINLSKSHGLDFFPDTIQCMYSKVE